MPRRSEAELFEEAREGFRKLINHYEQLSRAWSFSNRRHGRSEKRESHGPTRADSCFRRGEPPPDKGTSPGFLTWDSQSCGFLRPISVLRFWISEGLTRAES